MALERPEPGYVWLHVPRREPVEVTVVGDICTWWAHFSRMPGARGMTALRCLRSEGQGCAWCDASVGKRARYVFPVQLHDEARSLRLLEVGRVQYPQLSMVYTEGRWMGSRWRIRKEWDAANARIDMAYLGREHLSTEAVIDVTEYVETLGRAELRSAKKPQPF